MSEPEKFGIVGEWLAVETGEHTCGAGLDGHYGAHEHGCGVEPVMRLDDLGRLLKAAARFGARVVGDREGPHRTVQVFAGEPGRTRANTGSLLMRADEAQALIDLLGDAAP